MQPPRRPPSVLGSRFGASPAAGLSIGATGMAPMVRGQSPSSSAPPASVAPGTRSTSAPRPSTAAPLMSRGYRNIQLGGPPTMAGLSRGVVGAPLPVVTPSLLPPAGAIAPSPMGSSAAGAGGTVSALSSQRATMSAAALSDRSAGAASGSFAVGPFMAAPGSAPAVVPPPVAALPQAATAAAAAAAAATTTASAASAVASVAASVPVPVFSRSEDERRLNPERLNLDRRKLTVCPILEGEQRLRLLNFQNNSITAISNLRNLPELIFLDLYNNLIQRISGLEALPTLRVLMLGKNKIARIEGLEPLSRLDVLDLHSNQIESIENLSHLHELRVLNLAGNLLRTVRNLDGLVALTELNLRRNLIESVHGLDALPALQRVFLSNNRIASMDSIECLLHAQSIMELAFDGNPITEQPGYRAHLIAHIKSLRHLDMKRITEEERRAVATQLRADEQRAADRRRAELAAERGDPVRSASRDDLSAPATGGADGSLPSVAHGAPPGAAAVPSGGAVGAGAGAGAAAGAAPARPGHWELEGDTLRIVGHALEALDSKPALSAAAVILQQIEIDKVMSAVPRLRRLPALTALTLAGNGISSVHQLAWLATLRSVTALNVQDSPICASELLRPYLVFRLSALSRLNGVEITRAERELAERMFEGIHRACVSGAGRPLVPVDPVTLPVPSRALSEAEVEAAVVALAAPVRPSTKSDAAAVASNFVATVLSHAATIDAKLATLNREWDAVVAAFVRRTLAAMDSADEFVRRALPDDV